MAISSETLSVTYNANGSTTDFDITFDVILDSNGDATDIRVVLTDTDGNEGDLTETTHYTISGTTVTTVATYATGNKITLARDVPLTQTVDLVNGGAFNAETIETALDKQTLINQQQQEQLNRVVRIPITESADLTLPTIQNRAGQALIFDASGNIDVTPGTPPRLWSNVVEYENDEIVQYSGALYRSKQASNTGNTPAGGAGDTWWEEVPLNEEGWIATATYKQDALVADGGFIYISLQDDNVGNTPSSSPLWWDKWVGANFSIQTGDHTAATTITDAGPSIIAIDTDGGAATVNLPTLADNQGRKIYILNINAGNTITVNAEGSDEIGFSGDTSIEIATTDTATILIGTASYWQLVETGGSGGGGGMEIGTIYPYAGTVAPVGSLACDGSAVSRTNYADLFAAIGTTWGVGDGSTTFNLPDLRGAFVRGAGSHGSETMADGNPFAGPSVGAFEDDQMQGHWHSTVGIGFDPPAGSGGRYGLSTGDQRSDGQVNIPVADGTNGTPRTGDETRPFNAGVLYCIKATPATNSGTPLPTYSYSTGWVANSDWTDAKFTVTHGLNAPLSDLVVKFFISTDGTEENAFEVVDTARILGGTGTNTSDGLTYFARSNSSFVVQTGADGVLAIQDADTIGVASGDLVRVDTESYYYKVKVYRPEVLATELSTTSYDTGWVTRTSADWTNVELTVTHNLGSDAEDLIFQLWMDAGDGTNFPQLVSNLQSGISAGDDTGVSIVPVDSNSVKLQTGAQGVILLTDAGDRAVLASATTGSYRVKVYKPELISFYSPAAVKSVSDDYTITGQNDSRIIQVTTGASNYTITLPAGSGLTPGDEFEVVKVDSGAGEVTVSRAGSDTFSWQGPSTAVKLYSEGNKARVRWNGSKWDITELECYGSNSNGEFTIDAAGKQECWASASGTGVATASASGAYYGNGPVQTFPQAFSSAPLVLADISATGFIIWEGGSGSTATTTQFTPSIRAAASMSSRTVDVVYRAIGIAG